MPDSCFPSISRQLVDRLAAAALLATVAGGCASQLPVATDALGEAAARRFPGADRASLARGRELYIHRCAGCHALYVPSYFSGTRWNDAVSEMGSRTKMSDEEKELVIRYLTVASESGRGAASRTK